MGNQHSVSHANLKPRRNVHWKSAGRPAVPGKPEIFPILLDDEPNAITLRWAPATHDGGAPLRGYQVECNRLGTGEWIRTSPPLVLRPELVLTGLEPPQCYQFRVAALNAIGCSETSELSDVFTLRSNRGHHEPPIFVRHLEDITALENDKTEFRVTFTGAPLPTIAWFKDDYEIFSSRRTVITTTASSSILLFHQTLASDEGEIKCTATNRFGLATTKARLVLEAAPKLRYPRKYENGLLYEINETVFLKITIVGKPRPTIEWRHDGQPIVPDKRVENTNTCTSSMLKIHSARRSDRGEYQIHAKNVIGEDTAAFLVTITAPPDPPRHVAVARQLDKSIILNWEPPRDDGGCRVCNYIVEYYRTGWNVWLKATTSRKTSATLFDLIEGSEYRFRVKAESPYGISEPSEVSEPVWIPGRPIDMNFMTVESQITDAEQTHVEIKESSHKCMPSQHSLAPTDYASLLPVRDRPDKLILVLSQSKKPETADKAEKCKSFQLDLEEALAPPLLWLSAPELSSRCVMPFKALRNSFSSTELLQEHVMARFYKAVALEEEHARLKASINENNIPHIKAELIKPPTSESHKVPRIFLETVSDIGKDYKYNYYSHDTGASESKWVVPFDEDYTISTESTDGKYSEEETDCLIGDIACRRCDKEEQMYHLKEEVAYSSQHIEIIKNEDILYKQRLSSPSPLLGSNSFLKPKPILKHKEPDIQEYKNFQNHRMARPQGKPKKEEKIALLKNLTKVRAQTFSYPKICKKVELNNNTKIVPPNIVKKLEKEEKNVMITNEDRPVIEYYGEIVEESESQKKPAINLYLNNEELKTVSKKHQMEMKTQQKTVMMKPIVSNKTTPSKQSPARSKLKSSAIKKVQDVKKETQQIVLKTTERANIVIPIDYGNLEEQAKERVHNAINYAVDVCLLLLAFWLYLFKDERLAVPLLALIIYRQLQETLLTQPLTPDWIKENTPAWLKYKTS